MFSRRSVACVVLSCLVLTSCSFVSKILPDSPTRNAFSGREGTNGPVLVVKIDDTTQAHPQVGLEDADIVYIEQVEGGLTRLAAVFSSVIPQRIGPVRSARISDIDIVAQFGRVAFAYSGAQKKLLPAIAAANLQDLGAQRQSPTIFTTDPNRAQPYAMVLRADLLMQKIKDKNFEIDPAKSVGFIFGELQDGGAPTTKAVMHWPAATYSATWSQQESRWLLSHNNSADVAESGVVLGPTTLVIQMVTITPSEYKDKVGGVTPYSQTVGEGKAYVLRNGQRFITTWSRPSSDSGTTFTFADGAIMNFDPGQIWIALTDREPDFTSPPEVKTK
ncbi:MAG: DUF3048 domain-containing protein [Actinobacteria bacterium]|nr:DUF3048 domain-containing protein [Actinomycetota bacterium]